jgi:hypothetical protein
MKPFYHIVIERHSDYSAHDPYWINLYWYFGDEHKELSQAISGALNEFFRKRGPDANEDFSSTCSRSMQRETVDKALAFAIKKCNKLIPEDIRSDLPHKIIDGGWSQETDCREDDPVTGELLHSIPVNRSFVLDELQCLVEQDKMSKDDWVWCDFVVNSFGYGNSEINAMLNRIARKFR